MRLVQSCPLDRRDELGNSSEKVRGHLLPREGRERRTESGDGEGKRTDRDELPSVSIGGSVTKSKLRHTTPGRCISRGSFCVIRRYRNAADIMKAIRHPVPCVVMAHMPMADMSMFSSCFEASAAAMRLAANGAVRSSG